jgi:serine/threonine protein kinase
MVSKRARCDLSDPNRDPKRIKASTEASPPHPVFASLVTKDEKGERHCRFVFGKNTYVAGQRLGHGTYGVVYEAKSTQKKSAVAVKMFSDDPALEGVEEVYRREVSVMKRLGSHPSLLPIVTHGIDECRERYCAIVTPKMDRNLLGWVAPDFYSLMSVVRQLASGLVHMHRKGFVHGDFKSLNLLADMHVRKAVIADFGLSFEMEDATRATPVSQLKQPPGVVSTVLYRDPACIGYGARREPLVSGLSDVWSLGAVLFEFVCGRLMFLFPETIIDPVQQETEVMTLIYEEFGVNFELGVQPSELKLSRPLDTKKRGLLTELMRTGVHRLCVRYCGSDQSSVKSHVDAFMRLWLNMMALHSTRRVSASCILKQFTLSGGNKVVWEEPVAGSWISALLAPAEPDKHAFAATFSELCRDVTAFNQATRGPAAKAASK